MVASRTTGRVIGAVLGAALVMAIAMIVTNTLRSRPHKPSLEPEPVQTWPTRSDVTGLGMTADERIVMSDNSEAGRGPGRVIVFRPGADTPIVSLYSGSDPVNFMVISPDSRYAACSIGDRVDIFDLSTCMRQSSIACKEIATALAYSPDGSLLAGKSANNLMVWSTHSWRRLWTRYGWTPFGDAVPIVQSNAKWVGFSPRGDRLVASLFDLSPGTSRCRSLLYILDSKTGKLLTKTSVLHESADGGTSLRGSGMMALGAYGSIYLLSGRNLRYLRSYEWRAAEPGGPHDRDWSIGPLPFVYSMDSSPDGRVIAVGTMSTVVLLDSYTGQVLGRTTDCGPECATESRVAFSADGQYLAVAGPKTGVLYRIGAPGKGRM